MKTLIDITAMLTELYDRLQQLGTEVDHVSELLAGFQLEVEETLNELEEGEDADTSEA